MRSEDIKQAIELEKEWKKINTIINTLVTNQPGISIAGYTLVLTDDTAHVIRMALIKQYTMRRHELIRLGNQIGLTL